MKDNDVSISDGLDGLLMLIIKIGTALALLKYLRKAK